MWLEMAHLSASMMTQGLVIDGELDQLLLSLSIIQLCLYMMVSWINCCRVEFSSSIQISHNLF
jgi:hypothetical protein